jgi:hypothetical protein
MVILASVLAFLLLLSFMLWPVLLLMVTALLLMISLLAYPLLLLIFNTPTCVPDIARTPALPMLSFMLLLALSL